MVHQQSQVAGKYWVTVKELNLSSKFRNSLCTLMVFVEIT